MKYLCLFLVYFVFWPAINSVHADTCTAITGTDTCIETGSITTADGSVYTPPDNCKKRAYTQNCVRSAPLNKCSVLESNSNCTQNATSCISTRNGQCDKYRYSYQCTVAVSSSDITSAGSVGYETGATWNNSACSSLANNSNCSPSGQTCTEGAGTRIINGVSVTKDCWKYENTYNCTDSQVSPAQSCNDLKADSSCTQVSRTCNLQNDDGSCSLYDVKYQCGYDVSVTSGVQNNVMTCGASEFTYNGINETLQNDPNANIGEAATWLNVMNQAGKNGDFDGITIFNGGVRSCAISPVGYNNCCKGAGWGQKVSLAGCTATEKQIAQDITAGLMIYIGQACSRHIKIGIGKFGFKVCVEKSRYYCRFNSKLGRIIQEQGRPQLGWYGFGSAPSGDCRGFTPEQLQTIDFKQIDMREALPDITSKIISPTNSAMGGLISNRVSNFYSKQVPK